MNGRRPYATQGGGVLRAVQPLLELLVVFLFVTTFLFQITRIPSASMTPTLRVGDVVLMDMQSYTGPGRQSVIARVLPPANVHRGDLAVFHFPLGPSRYVVKRVIALPGDRLHLHHGVVFRNGSSLSEPYATHDPQSLDVFRDNFPSFHSLDPDVEPLWWAALRRAVHGGELTVPPADLFVLGDNRDESNDSRYWGFVPERNVVGRPLLVLFGRPRDSAVATGLWRRMKGMFAASRVVQ